MLQFLNKEVSPYTFIGQFSPMITKTNARILDSAFVFLSFEVLGLHPVVVRDYSQICAHDP